MKANRTGTHSPGKLHQRLCSPELQLRSSSYFALAEDHSSITCRRCGFVSHEPQDIERRFCPCCRVFHEDDTLKLRLMEGYEKELLPMPEDWLHFKTAA